MCLSIPAEILEINKNRAKVSVGGVIYNSSLDLIDNVEKQFEQWKEKQRKNEI